jgi:aryl-alcohol dehydrogenase-like predicted oxidoreductase
MSYLTTDQPVAASGTLKLGGVLAIRRLGFGAMRITGSGIWGEPANKPEAIAVLKRALELGVNLIDTADAYGPNVSEEIIAEALYPYPPELVIATKGGLLRGGPNNWYPDGRPEHLREALDGSLKRLRLERIDLYQFHRPDPAVKFADSVGTLADLQKAGKIGQIGLSNITPEQLAEAQAIVPIVTVQNRYNLADRASEALVDICAQQGIGFIPWFPLATGELAKTGGKLDLIAHNYQATPAQIALAWLLKRSPTMLPIPGTSSVAHLEENIKGATIMLSDADFATLSALHE